MIAYNRPSYFEAVLRSLAGCVGIERYTVLFFMEPVNERVIALARAFSAARETRVTVNPTRLGCHPNKKQAVRAGFEFPEGSAADDFGASNRRRATLRRCVHHPTLSSANRGPAPRRRLESVVFERCPLYAVWSAQPDRCRSHRLRVPLFDSGRAGLPRVGWGGRRGGARSDCARG